MVSCNLVSWSTSHHKKGVVATLLYCGTDELGHGRRADVLFVPRSVQNVHLVRSFIGYKRGFLTLPHCAVVQYPVQLWDKQVTQNGLNLLLDSNCLLIKIADYSITISHREFIRLLTNILVMLLSNLAPCHSYYDADIIHYPDGPPQTLDPEEEESFILLHGYAPIPPLPKTVTYRIREGMMEKDGFACPLSLIMAGNDKHLKDIVSHYLKVAILETGSDMTGKLYCRILYPHRLNRLYEWNLADPKSTSEDLTPIDFD